MRVRARRSRTARSRRPTRPERRLPSGRAICWRRRRPLTLHNNQTAERFKMSKSIILLSFSYRCSPSLTNSCIFFVHSAKVGCGMRRTRRALASGTRQGGVRDEEDKMSGGLGDKARVGMRDEDEEVSGDLGDEKDEGIARWGRRGGGRGERRGQVREEEEEACIGLGDKVSAGQGMGLGGRDECLLGTRRGLGCFLGRRCERGGVLERHRERGDVLGPAWRTRRRCPWPVS